MTFTSTLRYGDTGKHGSLGLFCLWVPVSCVQLLGHRHISEGSALLIDTFSRCPNCGFRIPGSRNGQEHACASRKGGEWPR